jgi:transposase
MPKPGNKTHGVITIQDPTMIAERQKAVTALYTAGWSESRIATRFKCTAQDVSDLISSHLTELATLRQQELARLDQLAGEYLAAWEESKKQAVRKTSSRKNGADAASVVQEDQYGDPRFLQGIERCIAKRCEILGIT